ncbi:SpoIIE family protein phosphatase [Methanolobus zinderi]|uniref:SpoIIE family protein phosphatase n=1 Tax=Methanolobus zinderi TaxID=536044 RepID=A0A7D5E7L1_9EURY|nr:SpoIIE family protein phosphatase [Methanolobus zinderi]QLC49037.1 SpoIIE family protein phosphatase [Methanolobus zinderi]
MRIAMESRSFNGDVHCGDQCDWWLEDNILTLCMIDGLGHGKHAEEAAKAALGYVSSHLGESLDTLFSGCDRAIKQTRGVAMGIVRVDLNEYNLEYGGIGNTRAMIYGENGSHFSSSWGIVGGGFRHLHIERTQLSPDNLLLMWTDGIPESLKISGYDRYLLQDEQELARAILGDHGRMTDDATILVYMTG